MTTVFAQGAAEYVEASGAAASAINAIGDHINGLVYTVSDSVAQHPLAWAVGFCVAGWLLFRSK